MGRGVFTNRFNFPTQRLFTQIGNSTGNLFPLTFIYSMQATYVSKAKEQYVIGCVKTGDKSFLLQIRVPLEEKSRIAWTYTTSKARLFQKYGFCYGMVCSNGKPYDRNLKNSANHLLLCHPLRFPLIKKGCLSVWICSATIFLIFPSQ